MYKRIKELRLEKGFTKAELAEHLSISVRSYSNLEDGKTRLRITPLVKLANFYDTSVDYILNITNVKDKHTSDETNLISEYRLALDSDKESIQRYVENFLNK